MTTDVAIRKGDRGDRAFVLGLGKRVAATSLSNVRPAPLAQVETAYERLVAFIEGRESELLIASDGETDIGFLILLGDLPDEVTMLEQAFIAYMAVEPSARGRGVGRALLLAAEDIARENGLPYLTLMVTEDNAAARTLYAASGFTTERRMMTKAL